MSATTKLQLTVSRTIDQSTGGNTGPKTLITVATLTGYVYRRTQQTIKEDMGGPGAAVPETSAVAVKIKQADNPTTPLWVSGIPIMRVKDTIKQSDSLPSQLNGQTVEIERVRTYSGQVQIDVRYGT